MAAPKKPSSHLIGRDAKNGRLITVEQARRRPDTSVVERMPNPGHGDTGRGKKGR